MVRKTIYTMTQIPHFLYDCELELLNFRNHDSWLLKVNSTETNIVLIELDRLQIQSMSQALNIQIHSYADFEELMEELYKLYKKPE